MIGSPVHGVSIKCEACVRATYRSRSVSSGEAILLQSPIRLGMFLKCLKWVGRTTQSVRHASKGVVIYERVERAS